MGELRHAAAALPVALRSGLLQLVAGYLQVDGDTTDASFPARWHSRSITCRQVMARAPAAAADRSGTCRCGTCKDFPRLQRQARQLLRPRDLTNCAFVWARPVSWSGHTVTVGAPFPSAGVSYVLLQEYLSAAIIEVAP
jgi:hypothetical protein